MLPAMRVALAQINTTIGDFQGNAKKVEEWCTKAAERRADVVLFPELTLCGYPPGDLVELPDFVAEGEATLHELARRLRGGPAAVVGFVERHSNHDRAIGLGLSNSVAWLEGGVTRFVARKSLLPNYDVFDERRWFDPAVERVVVERGAARVGLSICEDLWNDERFWPRRRYRLDPLDELKRMGARLVVNASASPYEIGKPAARRRMIAAAAQHHGVAVAYCNLVGGNDALVFDGHSMVVDARGELLAHAGGFEEELLVADVGEAHVATGGETNGALAPPLHHDHDEALHALVVGVRDYVRKTGFAKVVLGLSGGIDSALTAVVAARALGPENVLGVALPSRFTAAISNEDAAALARNLGIGFETLAIEAVVEPFRKALAPLLGGASRGLADENLQARVRGTALMALANQRGLLLLTTGNKSELAVGYCTLYGDMNGALAVIGDVPKTLVVELARHVNRDGVVIPARTIERPPTAELREGQTDEESLGAYAKLDPILRDLVVERRTVAQIAQGGVAEARAREVRRMLFRAEFKRRQAPPILKITPKAFGGGWRFPIAHRFGATP